MDLSVFGERDGDSVWLTIRVQDTGIGIRAEDKEKLFSDYSQLDTGSDRRVEGTGLGLPIAKKMVEMMDGELSVESEYGRGSTFTARIRQGHVTDVPIGPEVVRSLQSFHYFTQKNVWKAQRKFAPLPDAAVLIVDDNETNLDVVRSILKPYGMRVDCVLGGRQAIELVRKEQTRYDAIFMDHMMPGMDGIEAARVIREEIGTEYAETVPIVALTANAIVGSDQMFLQHGFQAFLSKPIDILRMDAVLERWVRKKERRTEETDPAGDGESAGARALPDMPSTVPPAALSGILSSGLPSVLSAVMEDSFPDSGLLRRERIDGLNLEEGLRRFGGDDDTLLAVLRSFAKNTPPLLERARLPDRENLKEYTTVVHGIKGSCYGICAPVLGKMAENLEREAKSGNLDFIEANNGAFLQAAETLLADIQALLKSVDEEERKECREEPDPSVLGRLRAACASYDMDGVDAAMAELERLTYARNAELIVWLREQVDRMNFQEILDRLPM